jgi:hypothetical protein
MVHALSLILSGQMVPLKLLSSEMDPAEIRFIGKAFIKKRAILVFRKIRQSSIL